MQIGGGKRPSCGIPGPITAHGKSPRTDAQVQLTYDRIKKKQPTTQYVPVIDRIRLLPWSRDQDILMHKLQPWNSSLLALCGLELTIVKGSRTHPYPFPGGNIVARPELI